MGDGLKLTGDRCRCMACGLPFNSTTAFEKHRVGEYRPVLDRRCLSVTEMQELGMSTNTAGFWITRAFESFERVSMQRTGS